MSDDDDPMAGPPVNSDDSDDEQEKEKAVEPQTALYVISNNKAHRVPKVAEGSERCGHIRCHHRIAKVPDGKQLGAMVAGADGWPRGDALIKLVGADKVVVLQGKVKDSPEQLHYVWYVLVEVEDVNNKQDHQILRFIPKAVYKDLMATIMKTPELAGSALLRLPATNNNDKQLNVQLNDFKRVSGEEAPKSACIMPVKPKPEKKKEANKPADEGSDKQGEQAADKQGEMLTCDRKSKSVASFWKAKPVAEKQDSEEAAVESNTANEKALKQEEKAMEERPSTKRETGKEQPGKTTKAQEKGGSSVGDKHKLDEAASSKSVMCKKRRCVTTESWEVAFCAEAAAIDFKPPAGATSAKFEIEWRFG